MRYLSHHSVLWAIPLVLQFTLSCEGSCQNESLRRLLAIYSEGISGLGALKSFQTGVLAGLLPTCKLISCVSQKTVAAHLL